MQRVWYLRGDGQKDRVSAFSRLRCVKHVLGTSTRLLRFPVRSIWWNTVLPLYGERRYQIF